MPSRTRLYQLNEPLNPSDLKTHERALRNLQGNILKSHGRAAAVHIFLTFQPRTRKKAREFLARFARKVTSSAKQLEQTEAFHQALDKDEFLDRSEPFAAIYLSASGYKSLGCSLKGFSTAFCSRMREADLDDPPPQEWERKFQNDIDAMILLAHDKVEELAKQLSLLRQEVSEFAAVSSEFGMAMYDSVGQTIEHFGYADGISQPLFYESDLEGMPRASWDPGAGPSLVLVRDPRGKTDNDCGTYFVFRKLEQNVKGFRRQVQKLATALELAEDLAGAMVIGRFRDGTPVAVYPEAQGKKDPFNNFRYSNPKTDPNGNRCPFTAHIRKANPRGELAGLEQERRRRITRRGISYGDPTPPGDDLESLPESGVGLLFQCCQADLHEQFETIQKAWANNGNSPFNGAGKDPVIGESSDGTFSKIAFPKSWGDAARKRFSFHIFVKLKGGEYFFAPSISFLRTLA
jgi:Dyp-type peroxidase family